MTNTDTVNGMWLGMAQKTWQGREHGAEIHENPEKGLEEL